MGDRRSSSVRAARASDRDAVLAVVRAAQLLTESELDEVAAELDGEHGCLLVHHSGADVHGVAFSAPERLTDRTWNLLMLAVHPDHQGAGRGGALVRATETELRRRGARLLIVETSGLPGFAGQRRFYAGLGYRQQGWIDDYFAPGDAKVVYAKSLDVVGDDAVPESGHVRPAGPDDLAHLQVLAEAFYAEDGFTTSADGTAANLRVLITSPPARVAVVDDGVPVAFAITTTGFGLEDGHIAELEDLYVRPSHRRTGLGRRLVDDAAGWAASRGCARLEVVIAPNGRDVGPLVRYYAGHGLLDDGRRLYSRPLR